MMKVAIGGSAVLLLVVMAPPTQSAGERLSPAALLELVLRKTPLIDAHNDLIVNFVDCTECPRDLASYDIGRRTAGRTDIPRWRQGRLGAQLLNAGWIRAEDDAGSTLQGFDLVFRLVRRYSGDLVLATTAADVRQAHSTGKIAVLLALESAGRFQNSTALVRQFARLGLRANIVAYNEGSDLADGCEGLPRHGGLSNMGREIVAEMNRSAVLVDLSHASDATMHDVIEVSQAPVIFSHSSARALANSPRNVPDDVLRRLRHNGGIVMITFVDVFTTQAGAAWWTRYEKERAAVRNRNPSAEDEVRRHMAAWERENPTPQVSVSDVADQFDHVRRVAGVDHLGIGSDFDGDPSVIAGLEDVSKYPNLLLELARRGWAEEDLRKVAGENFLRVLATAENVAARLSANGGPNVAREPPPNKRMQRTAPARAIERRR
jgi:membrane dipeptidase